MEDLDGTVALITGGGSGFGLATAARLAARGVHVVVSDIDTVKGEEAAGAVGGSFLALDVTDPHAWGGVVDAVIQAHGRLDIVHLNAGVAIGVTDLTALTDDDYRLITGVNLDGVVFGLRAVLPVMTDGGAIVATASLGGLTPMPMDPVYSATKHAVVALMRSIAPGLRARGITANALCPGFADTPLVTAATREQIAGWGVPLLDVEVVADTVLRIITEGGTGEAWFVQPGREPGPFAFRGVPGPR